ncbi:MULTISPECIES: cytochrome c oxidase assembly protein [Mycobacterium]|uniref:cytochrome c oxidase assembly protein n=1 Tax=Mycobacterium TaxID=1763 RepID=UPI002852CAD6|nr:cytochrome c oxidase assembly protein [Mycobacterium kiyosense]
MVVPAAGFAVAAIAVAAYGLLSGPRRYADAGNPYPGGFVSAAAPVGYFVASLLAALCLGALILVVTTSRPEPDGLLDPQAFRIHILAERVSLLWTFAAALMAVLQAAHDTGVGAGALLGSGALLDAVTVSETARAWVVVLICTLPISVTLRFTTRWLPHVVLLVPTVIAVVAPAVTGNAGQGPDHDYSTSAAIVLAVALAALTGLKLIVALTGAPTTRLLVLLQTAAGALAVGYGALLLFLLIPGWSFDSDFARLGLFAGAAVTGVWLSDCWRLVKRRESGAVTNTVGGLAMTAAVAAVAAMATQVAPRFLAHRYTGWDVYLGFELPHPPTIVGVLTLWRFDSFVGMAGVVLAVGYTVGFIRLRRQGNHWSVGRLVAWLAGCASLVITSSSGVRAYGSAMFSMHMAEHMILNMFIPVLLVLGGPVTLALRVLPAAGDGNPPGPREWLTWLLHSRVTNFLSHPIVAFVLFVGSPYIVYFTPLFDTFVRYHWGHEFMTIHFLIVGYLFYWAIIGIDPGPRRLPYPGRIGLLFAVMPFHAFFGVALMTMTSPVGSTFYRSVNLPWLSSILEDQHLGGGIAWTLTELPVIIVIVALVTQWARQDRRAAARSDRHADSDYADDDLDAYNAMLRELSRMRR